MCISPCLCWLLSHRSLRSPYMCTANYSQLHWHWGKAPFKLLGGGVKSWRLQWGGISETHFNCVSLFNTVEKKKHAHVEKHGWGSRKSGLGWVTETQKRRKVVAGRPPGCTSDQSTNDNKATKVVIFLFGRNQFSDSEVDKKSSSLVT